MYASRAKKVRNQSSVNVDTAGQSNIHQVSDPLRNLTLTPNPSPDPNPCCPFQLVIELKLERPHRTPTPSRVRLRGQCHYTKYEVLSFGARVYVPGKHMLVVAKLSRRAMCV